MEKIPDDLFQAFDWTPVRELLNEHGTARMRLTLTSDGLRIEALNFDKPHCSTCQCNRLHAEMPLGPDGKTRRTRSWHHG
jgi:hypothetical protein